LGFFGFGFFGFFSGGMTPSAPRSQTIDAMGNVVVGFASRVGRMLHWKREQVDRLFRLNHATRLDQHDAAFSALDRYIRISAKPKKAVA
jgi:hypothetical protein